MDHTQSSLAANTQFCHRSVTAATLPPNVIKLAQRMQDFSSKENSSLSVIDDWLDNPVNQCTAIGTKLTKNQIIEMIFGTNPLSSQYKEHEMIFSVWANGTKSWKSPPLRRYWHSFISD